MPIINIKGVGNIQFPDSMSNEDITNAIEKDILPQFPGVMAKEKRTWGEALTDTGASLIKGVGTLAQLPGQISDLSGATTPKDEGIGLQALGKKIESFGEEAKSPVLKAKETIRGQKIAEADGFLPEFGTAIKETIKDPALLTSFFIEQIPNLVGSMGGGLLVKGTTKALMYGATKEALEATLPKAAVRGAIGTGAIMQGADVGSDTYETAYNELTKMYPDMSDEEKQGIALSKGRIAALEAMALSIGASRLPGGASIERALVGKGLPGTGGFIKGALGEAVSEGVEEGGGAFAKNVGISEINPETDLIKGVGSAAGLGALGGALFGGPAGVVNARFDAAEKAKVIEFEDQRQAALQAIEDVKTAEDQARRDANAANNEAIRLRAIMESGSITDSKAFEELSAKVEGIKEKAAEAQAKADAIRDKADAEKAKFSAFAEAEPDLFGKVYPQIYKAPQEQETAGAPEVQTEQLELDLADSQGQLGLPGVGIAQPRLPSSEVPAPQLGRPVTEEDFQKMKINKTNTKLRAVLLGKDLNDPVQLAEVRDTLENWVQVGRGESINKGVGKFLDSIPVPPVPLAPQEQQKLNLRRPYGSMKKPVPEDIPQEEQAVLQQELDMELGQQAATQAPTPPVQEAPVAPTQREVIQDVRQPTQDVAGIAEPSIYVPGQRGATTARVAEPTAGGVVPDSVPTGQPVGGEAAVSGALDVAEGLNPRQVKEYNDAKAQYLTNMANESVSGINRKYGAPKGDPLQLALDSLANDLYAKENTKLANRFFRGLPNPQRVYVEDKIASFKQQERRGETEIARLDAMREQQAAIREEYGTDDTLFQKKIDESRRGFLKLGVGAAAWYAGIGSVEAKRKLAGPEVQALIRNNDLRGALTWISKNSTPENRRLAKDLLDLIPNMDVRVLDLGYSYGQAKINRANGTVEMLLDAKEGINEGTILHEAIHAAIMARYDMLNYYVANPGKFGPPKEADAAINQYMAVWKEFRALVNESGISKKDLPLWLDQPANNPDEFITYALTSSDLQAWLKERTYKGKTLWDKLKASIAKILGFGTAPNWLDAAMMASNEFLTAAKKDKADFGVSKQIHRITTRAGINTKTTLAEAKSAKQRAEELYKATGAKVSPPSKGPFQAIKETTPAEAKSAVKQFLNKAETMWMSSDAALNNRIRQELEKNGTDWDAIKDMMFQVSTSQAIHAEAMATVFLEKGDIEYDPKTFKFMGKDSKDSWQNIIKQLSAAAKVHDISFDDMSKYARKAFEAKRLKGLKESKSDAYIHMNDAQIAAGMEYYKLFPELNDIQATWNGVRKNAMQVAVDSGLYTKEQAKELLDFMDYVPFYRVEQLMANAGPKEYSRGLLDFAKNYKFKGSEQEVEDLFDNMERWVSYTVSRAVKNRTALNMKNAALQLMPDEVRELRQDAKVKKEQNTIDIWEDGVKKKYEFDDPLFVYAFQGAQPVTLPILKAASAVANILRKNIVLNPLFSISQISQDSIGAMFTSGLKQPFKLPAEVVKEFVKTLKGTSTAAKELYKYGAVGVRDYSAVIARNEVEIASGLKQPTKFQKLLAPLEKIAMASDNAVRQAVYNRTLAEGGDKATAVEKAFEIINFKRTGASATVTVLRQVVPFYGAYLQAQNVALKTLMGKGISPVERKEAHKVLLSTTLKVMALGFIYAALVADDDEYQKMDPTIRDRHLMIPGTGFMLPLRSDVFLLPKLASEYVYQGLTDQGFTDGKKMRRGMKDAITNAILSPTVVPQAAKPLLEVATNYNFFSGRPLIGQGLENKITSEQFTNTTSELAKFLGKAGLMAPITIDHLIRGYLGTTGGMGLMAVNAASNVGSDTPRPEKSWQDAIAATPGFSAFVAKEYGSGIKNDFYELRKEVDKAVNTFNNMRKTGRIEEAKELYEDKKDLFAVKSQVNNIERQLAKIRAREKVIYEAPESKMTRAQKGEEIEKLRQMEDRMLKNVGMLRERAGF